MDIFQNHLFIYNHYYDQCLICGLFKFNRFLKSCREMIDISKTHSWVKIPENKIMRKKFTPYGRYWTLIDPYYCNICNITGKLINENITACGVYTCNEYLMIKANE